MAARNSSHCGALHNKPHVDMLMFRLLIVLLVGWVCLAQAQQSSSDAATAAGPPVMHTLNLTLSPASIGWPSSSTDFVPLNAAATSTLCGALPSSVSNCTAFLARVNATAIAAYMSVIVRPLAVSAAVATTLQRWSGVSTLGSGGGGGGDVPTAALTTACAAVLQTALDPVAVVGGSYTMPCRDADVYSYLPSCAAQEVATTTVYVANPTGDTKAYFEKLLCPAQGGCGPVVVTVTGPTASEASTLVNITDAGAGLEAVLSYVADVRAAALLALHSTSPFGGNANAGVGASRIELAAGGRRVVLFSSDEYTAGQDEVNLHCNANTGMWAIAIVAVVPFALILFRYLWYKGRHQSKKLERNAIIADELRIMQGFTQGTETMMTTNEAGYDAPPPGMDAQYGAYGGAANEYYGMMDPSQVAQQQYEQQQPQQWMMDDKGNYYYDTNGAAAESWGAVNGDAEATTMNTAAEVTYSGNNGEEAEQQYEQQQQQYEVADGAAQQQQQYAYDQDVVVDQGEGVQEEAANATVPAQMIAADDADVQGGYR